MRVLVALDGSRSSDAVMQEVVKRPWPAGSQFVLATVVDPYFFPKAPQLLQETKTSTEKSLQEQASPLVEAGWNVSIDIILDNPRHALPRAAGEHKADLVIMGSHGRGAVGRLLLGSTAQAVLRHAECSVEIVRKAPEKRSEIGGGMRVLIPTDGSECAEMAEQSVAERPWPAGSEFLVIASPEYPVLVGEYPYYAPEQLADLTKSSREHANDSAKAGGETLRKAGLKVTCAVPDPKDSPAHSILSAAEKWGADLIVLGSHGRRGFDRLILGSVSETVALHANCSVEVVRRPAVVL